MSKRLLYIFIFSLVFFSFQAFAQEKEAVEDTVKKPTEGLLRGTVFYFYDKPYQVGVPDFTFIDTVGYHLQRYNPSESDNKIRAEHSNIGLSDQLLEFELNNNIGFNYGIDPFKTYRFKFDNTEFYQTGNPYTDLFYANSPSGKENVFSVLHSQNVIRGLNLGIEYRNIHSEGTYQRQETRHHALRMFGNYISKNQQYRALAGYYYNKIYAQENGGIVNDTFVTNNNPSYQNRDVIPVNLTASETKWKEHSFYLKQTYHMIGGNRDTSDTPFSIGYLSLATDIKRYQRKYSDNAVLTDNFYDNVYMDSITADSIFIFSVKNTFSWNIGDLEDFSQQRLLKFAIGMTHQYVDINNYNAQPKESREYLIPFGKLQLSWKNYLILSGDYSTVVGGENDKDYNSTIVLKWNFNPSKNQDGITLSTEITAKEADWFMLHQYSNNFWWDNNFNKQNTSKYTARIDWKGITVSGAFMNFDNYVYLTKDAPMQSPDNFSLMQAVFAKDFKFGRFHIDNRIIYQKLSDESYMHLPELLVKQSYYVDFMVVRKALLRIGVDLTYNTKYYADAYNPALGSCYWQNDVKTGNYVYLDPFITFNIKRASIFVKYSHANYFIEPFDYFMTPHYPMKDGSFAYGIRWKFYD